jgi:hypothetical protein
MVTSKTAPGEPEQKRIKREKLDKKLFLRKLKNWGYALVVSLLPFILVFFLHNRTAEKLYFF